MASTSVKRRRGSSPPDQQDAATGPYRGLRREYGDTYVSGSANVHFGDRIHFDNNAIPREQEIRRIQDSLTFPHMHERYESLREASTGTYGWILEPESNKERGSQQDHMTPFFHWFSKGTGSFWISGKPGSGKSTLMKYLVENTISEPARHTLLPSAVLFFFFWIGGIDLQRNKIGCTRSLLWQALETPATKDVAFEVCQSHFKGSWTDRLLGTVLVLFLQKVNLPIAIFLDGLDESNDHDDILNYLKMVQSAPNVKLCVSSRPETTLIDSLKSCLSLKLQNLNLKDIQHVIQTTFLDEPRVQALIAKPGSDVQQGVLQRLSQEIEWKAEGVFLWVVLVIKDLLRGITQRDDLTTLAKRLDRLPNDISMLYRDLLQRAQPDSELYRDNAALYLSLALHRPFGLIEFCFAIDEDLRKQFLHSSFFERNLSARTKIDCEKVMSWVCTRTAGLLEVRDESEHRTHIKMYIRGVPHASERTSQIAEILDNFQGFYVRLVHRTAYDFLRSTAQGHSLFKESSISRASIEQICFETKVIFQLVLRGTLNCCIKPTYLGRTLNCSTCSDRVMFEFLQSQGQCMVGLLRSTGLLLPDTTHWMVWRRRFYSIRRRGWAFPSSKSSANDLLPALVKCKRYGMARMWLDTQDYTGDSVYLTMLLVGMVNRENIMGQPETGFTELLQRLIEGGADLSKSIITEIGEVFNPLDAAFNGRDWTLDMRKKEFHPLLPFDPYIPSAKSWPSCADCHDIWYRQRENHLAEDSFEFWGFLCGQKKNFFSKNVSQSASLDSEEDRIFLVASCPGGSSVPTKLPRFWAVSEIESQLLRKTIRLHTDTRNCRIEAPGTCRVFFNRRYPSKALRGDIEKVCAKSPISTFAGAMRLLEKTPKTIQKFYECEAKRMAFESEDSQVMWKQWYWGDENPAASDEAAT